MLLARDEQIVTFNLEMQLHDTNSNYSVLVVTHSQHLTESYSE